MRGTGLFFETVAFGAIFFDDVANRLPVTSENRIFA
jgi:hypothetical protein